VTVNGLAEIFAELYGEGRVADRETTGEIMNRLEARQNYIPSSEIAPRGYRHILLREYEEYLSGRAEKCSK